MSGQLHGLVGYSDAMKPFYDAIGDLGDGEALASRAARDGYLYFPGLLPAAEIAAARRAILPDLDALGWVQRTSADDDRATAVPGCFVDDAERVVGELVCRQSVLPEMQRLQHHPVLIGLFERLFDAAVLPLPRILMRYNFPRQVAHTTSQHQDFPHVQGTDRVFTAWIPLDDCGGEMGGLQVAAGSNRLGVLPLHPAMGAGGMAVPGDFSGDWHGGDMAAGDVLVFNCLTVHAGRPNVSDRIRLSVDLRYQPQSEPITEEWLHPHRRVVDWEELYRDLPDDTWKYYWRKLDLTIVPTDPSYYEARDEMALQMAEAGDRRALATLRRIANGDSSPAKRQLAVAALRQLEANATG